MARNCDKKNKREIDSATVVDPHHIIFFAEILSGNLNFIRKNFFYIFGKGGFTYLGSKCNSEIQQWVQDLCQMVSLVVWEKAISGNLGEIRHPKAFIKQIIRNKSIDENNRLSKFISIDSILEEDDNE